MPLLRQTLRRKDPRRATYSAAPWRGQKTISTGKDKLQLSFIEGPTNPPLIQKTLPAYFSEHILPKFAHRSALITRHDSVGRLPGPVQKHPSNAVHWSFAEFDERIAAAARGLIRLGITKGDRVAVIMGNNSAYAILQWACARIGAILVTIRTLNAVQATALVVVPQIRTSKYVDQLVSSIPSLSSSSKIEDLALPSLKHVIVTDNCAHVNDFRTELGKVKAAIPFSDLLVFHDSEASTTMDRLSGSLDQHDVINLQFTSGTTGLPKAVSLTHHNLANNGWLIGQCMNFTEQDKLSRLVLGNLAAWLHGACIVYPAEIYNPPAILDALHEEQCTAVHGVPTHFPGLLDAYEKDKAAGTVRDFSRLRTGIAAGSPIPIDLMKQLIEKLNLRDLTIAYGMSQPGELCVSGYNVQKGYWDDPEQTAEVLRPDPEIPGLKWMHTGDTAIMDEEGYLRIVGRIKDIIIRGGENLFPVQIENALTAHPAINEASVVSVPDSRYGEVVGAWIGRQAGEPKITREDVRSWVAEQMNPQNAPAWVWFLGEEDVEAELPKTASGKIQKNILRDWSKTWAQKGAAKCEVVARSFGKSH
ncbi:hypothetical protein FRC04_007722 [Tulasnella sp. 424]|nr:hypothetical protein FRC04_007722 [Tulasnella sp. 424]